MPVDRVTCSNADFQSTGRQQSAVYMHRICSLSVALAIQRGRCLETVRFLAPV